MRQNAADRLPSLAGRMLLAVLGAAALLVGLGGCGEFNDDPNPAGLTVSYAFDTSRAAAAGNGDTSTPFAHTPCTGCEAVHTVVVGAIVITHANGLDCSTTSASTYPICPYTDPDQVSGTNEDKLEDDAEQSIQYLSLTQLSGTSSGTSAGTASFAIPPRTAGNWQLIAVGLRTARTGIDDIDFDRDPTWYGFTSSFLNGTVSAGGTAPTLTLKPWCGTVSSPETARDTVACGF